jgi:hypothetical protein
MVQGMVAGVTTAEVVGSGEVAGVWDSVEQETSNNEKIRKDKENDKGQEHFVLRL